MIFFIHEFADVKPFGFYIKPSSELNDYMALYLQKFI